MPDSTIFTGTWITPAFTRRTGERVELTEGPFLGALHFWTRAMLGACLDLGQNDWLEKLRYLEGRLWGGPSMSAGVEVRVSDTPASGSRQAPQNYPFADVGCGRAYLAGMGLRHARKAYLPGQTFSLELRQYRDEPWLMPAALASLWLLMAFGGVGARTRRGFGCFTLSAVDAAGPDAAFWTPINGDITSPDPETAVPADGADCEGRPINGDAAPPILEAAVRWYGAHVSAAYTAMRHFALRELGSDGGLRAEDPAVAWKEAGTSTAPLPPYTSFARWRCSVWKLTNNSRDQGSVFNGEPPWAQAMDQLGDDLRIHLAPRRSWPGNHSKDYRQHVRDLLRSGGDATYEDAGELGSLHFGLPRTFQSHSLTRPHQRAGGSGLASCTFNWWHPKMEGGRRASPLFLRPVRIDGIYFALGLLMPAEFLPSEHEVYAQSGQAWLSGRAEPNWTQFTPSLPPDWSFIEGYLPAAGCSAGIPVTGGRRSAPSPKLPPLRRKRLGEARFIRAGWAEVEGTEVRVTDAPENAVFGDRFRATITYVDSVPQEAKWRT